MVLNHFQDVPDDQWQRATEFLAEVPELNYMTQIVLMLYEDPKADPLSENRFHVEMYFCPGAKTIDDPEFLARSSPPRKQSEEEVRHSSFGTVPTDLPDVRRVSKTSEVDSIAEAGKSDEHREGVSHTEDSPPFGLETSSLCVLTTDSNSALSEESAQSLESADVSSTAVTQSTEPALLEEEAISKGSEFEPYSDKPFDETVYAGNERPRCAIGIENYSDTALEASTGDSALSSGTSIEESSGEEKALKRKRNCLSESEVHSSSMSDSALPRSSVGASTEHRSIKSDSDIASLTSPRKGTPKGSRETSSITCIVEKDESEPRVHRLRPKSHSLSGPPSSASPTDVLTKFPQGKMI